MNLTEEQILNFSESIKRKNANVVCPMCHCTTFDVVKREAIIQFPDTTEHGVILAPINYRKCLINICSNCGYVLTFDIDSLSK